MADGKAAAKPPAKRRGRPPMGKCERAVSALWRRAKQLGVDEAQWGAAFMGASEAGRAIDRGVEGANALAAVLTAFRQYEAELRAEVDMLKRMGEDTTPEQVRLIREIQAAESERRVKGSAGG